jgi:hypothetical protein
MNNSSEKNKRLVLEAFDTLFNKHDIAILTYSDLGELLARSSCCPNHSPVMCSAATSARSTECCNRFPSAGGCESDQHFLVHRIYALWGSGNVRHRELLREIWLRFSHARQVGPFISAERGYRSLISTIYPRKGASTQSVVRLLVAGCRATRCTRIFRIAV